MAGVMFCEPRQLYNIINQYRWRSRLTEPNYLCLLDARSQREFSESHIITAQRIELNPAGQYLIPNTEELGYVRFCVVYDHDTDFLGCTDHQEEEIEPGSNASSETESSSSGSTCSQSAGEGDALLHARNLEQFTRHPVLLLKGGYKRFSACYTFLRSQKTLWMPQVCRRRSVPPCVCSRFTRSRSFFFLPHHFSFHRRSAGRGSSAGVLQPGDQPQQHSHHGLSDALLPLFPAESLEIPSEMQNEHETTPELCGTALSLGDPNLWAPSHRHL
ncbi:serine/threonine/tyrosine-interacting-like protein 1 isoform X2 [Prinia subflava]|uniref:serine/threonine/tyrosine-interacting-like protein 1 isoform X2 n=1 Tax=Prinia subflava TaxID=208062 RepID=UPI002FE42B5D